MHRDCGCCWQGEDMKERLLRTLADMENLRERTARATAEAKQYATQVQLAAPVAAAT